MRVSNDKQKIIGITATPYGENDKVSKNPKQKTVHVRWFEFFFHHHTIHQSTGCRFFCSYFFVFLLKDSETFQMLEFEDAWRFSF